MFLIERLPKETEKTIITENTDITSLMEQTVISQLAMQQQSLWTPEFCSSHLLKHPRSNIPISDAYFGKILKIPVTQSESSTESRNYWKHFSPAINKQNSSELIFSSLIATNDVMLSMTTKKPTVEKIPDVIEKLKSHNNIVESPKAFGTENIPTENVSLEKQNTILESPTTKINLELESLEKMIESSITQKQQNGEKLKLFKLEINKNEDLLKELKTEKKVHERINILLEDPNENIKKIETIIASTIEKSKNIELQWKTHEENLLEELNVAKSKHSKEYVS